jgi:hypothetical protein
MKIRYIIQGFANRDWLQKLQLIEKSKNPKVYSTLKTVLEFKASLIAASFAKKEEIHFALYVKNIQPISVGV